MAERPQVRDLEAPERIRPSGIPDSTFAAPSAPPTNTNFTQLVSALDAFNGNVKQLLDNPEEKHRVKQEHLAQYEAMKATRTNGQLVEAARAGQLPYWSDPYIKEVVHRDYAQLEAEALSTELDSDISNAKIEGFGKPTFKPEEYILERAKPYLERVKGDPASMVAFGGHLDTVRKGFLNAHQKVLGEVQTAAFDNVARDQIDRAITAAMDERHHGGDITTGLRDLYKELGPRAKGGSLDLKYQHLDNLLMEVLERKVKDPRYAAQTVQMLHGQRVSVDDNKTPLGSLASISARADKVLALENAAVKTLADDADKRMKETVLAHDVEVLGKNDGAFSTIMDFDQRNPVDESRTVSVGASKRKEEAVKQFIAQTRQKNNGKADFDTEFEAMRNANVKHPEWFPLMESAAVNLTVFSGKGGLVPQSQVGIERFQQAADLYNRMADLDYNYTKEHTSKTARDAYEMFATLTRYAGREPQQAAHEVAMVFSSEVNSKDPHIAGQGRIEDIQQEVRRMKFNGYWPLKVSIVNTQEVENRVTELATVLSRVEGLDPDTCIKAAAERIHKASVYINGRAIIDPGIKQGDEEPTQHILNDFFEKHKSSLIAAGIEDATHLSIIPFRQGQFLVIPWNGGAGPFKFPVYGEVMGVPGGPKFPMPKEAAHPLYPLNANEVATRMAAHVEGDAGQHAPVVAGSHTPLLSVRGELLRYDVATITSADIQKKRREIFEVKAAEARKRALEEHRELLNRDYQGQEFWWSED